MSFETFNIAEELSNEHEGERDHETTRIRNEMQAALIQHACPPNDNWGECIDVWVKTIAPEFEKVFDDLSKNNPELVAEWATNQARVLDEIHGRLPLMPGRDSESEGLKEAA